VEFATQLAAQNYNIVLVARRREMLDTVAAKIRAEYGKVEVAVVTCDLMAMGQSTDACRQFMKDVDAATHQGDIGILVANAGNSDLARHFTDHSLDRNRNMLHLNTLGNVSLCCRTEGSFLQCRQLMPLLFTLFPPLL
jgi:short-subunit dehydrogenase